jgi:hypothetical protein
MTTIKMRQSVAPLLKMTYEPWVCSTNSWFSLNMGGWSEVKTTQNYELLNTLGRDVLSEEESSQLQTEGEGPTQTLYSWT